MADIIFNHDGYGVLAELYDTDRTEEDAANLLVRPLAEAGISTIDWGLSSTVLNNIRLPGGHPHTPERWERLFKERPDLDTPQRRRIPEVVAHYIDQPRDLLDIVVHHGHAAGMRVFASLRLNHAPSPLWLEGAPGPRHHEGGKRIDFRDESFHVYLEAKFAALLERDVDGITLDFERKAPFFPKDAPMDERIRAGTRFVERIRALSDKPMRVRVCHDAAIGAAQGQDPEGWIRAGLVDSVVPATHNHCPDPLDWGFERFVAAAREAPRTVRVCPQIWPTGGAWNSGDPELHTEEAILERARNLVAAGADGIFFFNFHGFWLCPHYKAKPGRPQRATPPSWEALFGKIAAL